MDDIFTRLRCRDPYRSTRSFGVNMHAWRIHGDLHVQVISLMGRLDSSACLGQCLLCIVLDATSGISTDSRTGCCARFSHVTQQVDVKAPCWRYVGVELLACGYWGTSS